MKTNNAINKETLVEQYMNSQAFDSIAFDDDFCSVEYDFDIDTNLNFSEPDAFAINTTNLQIGKHKQTG